MRPRVLLFTSLVLALTGCLSWGADAPTSATAHTPVAVPVAWVGTLGEGAVACQPVVDPPCRGAVTGAESWFRLGESGTAHAVNLTLTWTAEGAGDERLRLGVAGGARMTGARIGNSWTGRVR